MDGMRAFPLFNSVLRTALNAAGWKVKNLGAPTDDNDAATKKYVDEHQSTVTLDDDVTQTSANGVKSSGIWSWVKSLLPSWLTASTEEPRGKTDFDVAGEVTGYVISNEIGDWECHKKVSATKWVDGEEPAPGISRGAIEFNASGVGVHLYREAFNGEDWVFDIDFGSNETAKPTDDEFTTTGGAYDSTVTTQFSAAQKLARTSKLTAGGLVKFGADGVLDVATEGVDYLKTHQDISGKANRTAFADAYDTAESYAVGDVVDYNGVVYQCVSATSGGAWDATKWEERKLDDFFRKSDTFATDHTLKNAVLAESVNALIDYKVGDVNAVLAAALDGSEVA